MGRATWNSIRTMAVLAGVFWTASGWATTQVSNYAGVSGGGSTLSTCSFNTPIKLVWDSQGNSYIADSGNHVIRKIAVGGAVSVLAGTFGVAGSADGVGLAASFYSPKGLAYDRINHLLYVADSGNGTIRRIDLTTTNVTRIAGRVGLAPTNNYIGAPLTAAGFNNPTDLVLDPTCTILYVADTGYNVIKMITGLPGSPLVEWLAGNTQYYPIAGSTDTNTPDWFWEAGFNGPYGLALDGSGAIYVADTNNNMIRKITRIPIVVTTVTGQQGNKNAVGAIGSAEGSSVTAKFSYPRGLTVNGTDLYISDTGNNTLRKIDLSLPARTASTVAGTAGTTGNADGSGAAAQFNHPQGISFATNQARLTVVDTYNDMLRSMTVAGAVTTVGGGLGDGLNVPSGTFKNPNDICIDNAGNQYIADTDNYLIRKISAAGLVSTLAGKPGVSGSADGTGPNARFASPRGLALSPDQGSLYVADADNHTVRRINLSTQAVVTIAGSAGASGFTNGNGTAARFNYPQALAVRGMTLYIADTNNNYVRTLACGSGTSSVATGIGPFSYPSGLLVDPSGNTLFVADTNNHVIKKVVNLATFPQVSTFIGTSANLNHPRGMAFGNGFLFLSDPADNNLYIIDPARATCFRLAGLSAVGNQDGDFNTATFNFPAGMAYHSGRLFVADSLNNRLRLVDQLFEVRDVSLRSVGSVVFPAVSTANLVAWVSPVISGSDTLTAVTVINTKQAQEPKDLQNLTAWYKPRGGTFSSSTAVKLGTLEPFGPPINRTWRSNGTSFSPKLFHQSDELYVTVDISTYPTATGTTLCMFQVPANGLTFSSGGPWPTAPLTNDYTQLIAPAGTAFTVAHESLMPPTVAKGQSAVPAMKLTINNVNILNVTFPLISLRFRVEDKENQLITPNTAVTGLGLSFDNGASIPCTSTMSGTYVDVSLTSSINVEPGKSLVVRVYMNMASQPTAETVRLDLFEPNSVNDGRTGTIAAPEDPGFPMRSDYCRIQNPDLAETYSNFPNPFAPPRQITQIQYYLSKPAKVSLSLWTLTEQRVKTLLQQDQEYAGLHTVAWDGKNGQDLVVLSGIYISRLTIRYNDGQEQKLVRKIAVIR